MKQVVFFLFPVYSEMVYTCIVALSASISFSIFKRKHKIRISLKETYTLNNVHKFFENIFYHKTVFCSKDSTCITVDNNMFLVDILHMDHKNSLLILRMVDNGDEILHQLNLSKITEIFKICHDLR